MELKDFVAETLKQIIDGIEMAQRDVRDKKAIVSPMIKPMGSTYVMAMDGICNAVQMIDFEVSLTETEGKEKGGRIGVLFSFAGAGAQAKSESGSSMINRVKFSVPLMLPQHYLNEK
jgi:phage tail tape-measure protein